MSSESGTVAIGEEEYQLQVRKHGSVKHVGLLAKQVARVILMMGLGPTDGILGAAGSWDSSCKEDTNLIPKRKILGEPKLATGVLQNMFFLKYLAEQLKLFEVFSEQFGSVLLFLVVVPYV